MELWIPPACTLLGFLFAWWMQRQQQAHDRQERREDFERQRAADLDRSKLEVRRECYAGANKALIDLLAAERANPDSLLAAATIVGELDLFASDEVRQAANGFLVEFQGIARAHDARERGDLQLGSDEALSIAVAGAKQAYRRLGRAMRDDLAPAPPRRS